MLFSFDHWPAILSSQISELGVSSYIDTNTERLVHEMSSKALDLTDGKAGVSKQNLSSTSLAVSVIAAVLLLTFPISSSADPKSTIEGKLTSAVKDDLKHHKATHHYYVETKTGQRKRLVFEKKHEAQTARNSRGSQSKKLVSGTKVKITGDVRRKTIRTSIAQIKAIPSAQTANIQSIGLKKVAVILINFRNDTTEPWTVADIRNNVFTGVTSVNNYFQEVSSGATSLEGKVSSSGDIFGFYTIPYDNTGCSYSTWGDSGHAAAIADGNDLSGYDHIIYGWANTPDCWWSGMGQIHGSLIWIDGAFNPAVTSHELGHNFGEFHASSYTCTDSEGGRVPISSSCSASEYGDPFSVMGVAYDQRHVHNFNKGNLGYLSTADTITAAVDGDYTLKSSEQLLADETQIIRVPRLDGTYYYLEYRRPYGAYFDAFDTTDPVVNGITIRIAPDFDVLSNSKLIDNTPATASFDDAALGVGNTFTDSSTGIAVTTLSTSSTEATVRIQAPPTSPPVNSSPPVVAGTARLGETLTCSLGSWDYRPTSYSYQWLRDGNDISGATSRYYTVVSTDLSTSLSCRVAASNIRGSVSASSNALQPIVTLPSDGLDKIERPDWATFSVRLNTRRKRAHPRIILKTSIDNEAIKRAKFKIPRTITFTKRGLKGKKLGYVSVINVDGKKTLMRLKWRNSSSGTSRIAQTADFKVDLKLRGKHVLTVRNTSGKNIKIIKVVFYAKKRVVRLPKSCKRALKFATYLIKSNGKTLHMKRVLKMCVKPRG